MKNKTPKISVLMPNYNWEKYISEAIESILNQNFTDFEFIIIDDGSSDKSWEIIQDYAKKDERIVALKNEENLWVQNTRNKLFEEAQWEYYAFFDSDDISYLNRLEIQIEFFKKHSDIDICGSNFEIINKDWNITETKKFPETDDEIKKSFFYRNPFGQNTILLKAKCVKIVGWYNTSFTVAEDLDLWVRLWVKYKMHNIQENLIQYRIHWQNSILTKQKLHIQNTLKIRKKAIQLGYKITFTWRIHYFWTWCMQFLPPKLVLFIFNKLHW